MNGDRMIRKSRQAIPIRMLATDIISDTLSIRCLRAGAAYYRSTNRDVSRCDRLDM